MKVVILSDIHSNIEALNAVLDECNKEEIDKYVALGDIVGYGADPNECVRIIKNLVDINIMGNHDSAALDRENLSNFNPYARQAALWTQKNIDNDVKKYLSSLSFVARYKNFLFIHATPSCPESWDYLYSATLAQFEFKSFLEQVCFIGHSHIPVVYQLRNGQIKTIFEKKIQISDDSRYIVNVGSIGQPRDRDPRSSFVIVELDEDLKNITIEIRRIQYDILKAQQKILMQGLPEILARRLSYGG